MKKLILAAVAGLFCMSVTFAQQWIGNNSSSSTIYRTGNVGIGTSNPLNKLQIGNSFSFHDGGHEVLGFGYARGSGGGDLNSNAYSSEITLDPVSGRFSLGVSSTKTGAPVRSIIMTRQGRVGIGSANPDAKLTVRGDIHAISLRLDAQVPADYVFQKYYTGFSTLKEDYTMPSLQEVEKFTQENNHLPGVPSAREIMEEGLDVGEMSNLLLQKIEELTLYTIEQEKRIEQLELLISKN